MGRGNKGYAKLPRTLPLQLLRVGPRAVPIHPREGVDTFRAASGEKCICCTKKMKYSVDSYVYAGV